jgi:hypothetical protein
MRGQQSASYRPSIEFGETEVVFWGALSATSRADFPFNSSNARGPIPSRPQLSASEAAGSVSILHKENPRRAGAAFRNHGRS